MGIITRYIEAAMRESYIRLLDNGCWYAHIPLCPGVWATDEDPQKCKAILREVLEEWLLLKLRDNDPLEKIGDIAIPLIYVENKEKR